eukprot:1377738-Ditylum_brightwellii.AAC.1
MLPPLHRQGMCWGSPETDGAYDAGRHLKAWVPASGTRSMEGSLGSPQPQRMDSWTRTRQQD